MTMMRKETNERQKKKERERNELARQGKKKTKKKRRKSIRNNVTLLGLEWFYPKMPSLFSILFSPQFWR